LRVLVRTGGELFEHFIVTQGTRKTRNSWTREITQLPLAAEVPAELQAEIIERERVGFYTFIVHALNNRGNSVTHQLFYTTMLLRFRGLSRSALTIMSNFSACVPPSTFDRFFVQALIQQADKVR
jgi:hypothetical protein